MLLESLNIPSIAYIIQIEIDDKTILQKYDQIIFIYRIW